VLRRRWSPCQFPGTDLDGVDRQAANPPTSGPEAHAFDPAVRRTAGAELLERGGLDATF
jgi:hypothetical protein